MRIHIVTLLLCLTGLVQPGSASTGLELERAFDIMYDPTLDDTAVYEVSGLTIEHRDMTLYLDSGRIYLCEPVEIDGTPLCFGGYFEGKGNFQFYPSVPLERDQLLRFFETDSLNRAIESAELLFGHQIHQLILDSCTRSQSSVASGTRKGFRKAHSQLVHHERRGNIYRALKCLTEPAVEPYLLVNVEPDGTERVCYRYYPFAREEVRFFKTFGLFPLRKWLELICSYSPPSVAEAAGDHKVNRIRWDPVHYEIATSIDSRGECVCQAELSCEVLAPLKIVALNLHPKLEVDSILDSSGRSLRFKRWEKKKNRSDGLYLFLEEVPETGTTTTLTFFYHGKIAERHEGEFFVQAGAEWYPRLNFNQKTTFEMLFRTPNHFGFAAVGTIIDSTVVEDVMTTRYRVSDPAPNVSFNIGIFTTHRLTEKEILPKGVHFTNPRHKELLNGLTLHTVAHNRDVEKHVARDVMGSLQLFEHHFGQLPIDKLVVAEILALHSESYPGFVQMGLMTFLRSDPSGYQRMHRSHEVAHQWWGFGSGVGFKTYHDKWLSEGFAEYSGMLFQEETSGHKKFLEVLKEYREEIFGARKYLLTSGAESGPIIMGSRTASTKTKGDFDLVIYKKAALVLHMLRNLLMDLGNFSDERFYSMMKDWYLTNRGRQMTTNDFKEHCDKHFGIDMAWFFDQWVYGNDLPTYRFSYECKRDTGGVFVCPCEVKTENVGPAFQMYVPIEIEMRDKQKFYYRQLITGPTTVFDIAGLEDMPKKLRFNPFESVLADVKQ